MEEEAEAEDELLPAMADDDYSAQLSWQSQSKDNLKCVFFFFFGYVRFISFSESSWTILPRSSTSASRHIAVMPSRSKLFERYDTFLFNSLCTSAVACFRRSCSNSASWQVIQQSLGQQVSMPVAQIVAGFTKVFVGEIVEKGDYPFAR
jgi:transcription initiation factor TFIID subunit 11